jgi:hypothetical protein
MATITYLGFAAIVVVAVVWGAFTRARPGYSTPSHVLIVLTRTRTRRILVVLFWTFIGWHLFVRGSGAFE